MQEYISKMVLVFREVRRVLRKDGVCFMNLGDSYAGSWGNYGAREGKQRTKNKDRYDRKSYEGENGYCDLPPTVNGHGLKPKDLCGIPWRVALALQDDGWYLRSDIIWNKPNPMPESVTDRPTKSHEYIFLLTKSAKYFWDQEAVREKAEWERWGKQTCLKNYRNIQPIDSEKLEDKKELGRNIRSVWTISTESFPDAHFATYPQKLVETCIKAGTSEWGCCPECGKPWVRVVEKEYSKDNSSTNHIAGGDKTIGQGWEGGQRRSDVKTKTLGWRPSCTCGYPDPIPCTVFDPFLGSGTTGLVAQKMDRSWIGIELNPQYAEMAEKRINKNNWLF